MKAGAKKEEKEEKKGGGGREDQIHWNFMHPDKKHEKTDDLRCSCAI